MNDLIVLFITIFDLINHLDDEFITLDTFLIAWFITGEPLVGLSIITIEVVTKFALYYAHERAWSKMSWGQNVV